ncbi:MAG: hypothetical protein ACRCU1_02585 [Alsobacter sp.]
MEPRETDTNEAPKENETFSGSITSWGECVVTPRAQLEEQAATENKEI